MGFQALSPSSFIKYLNCPEQIKLMKVDEVLPRHAYEQTLPMCVGTAFDAMVKHKLNRRVDLQALLADIRPQNRKAIEVAEAIMLHYENGPFAELKKEGVGYTGADQELELEFTDITGKKWISMARGLPDLVLTDGTVIDWKVNGAFSSWGAEPKPGWLRSYMNGIDIGPHQRADMFLEEIDRDWAIQVYIYARLLGHPVGKQLRAGIDQVAVDKDSNVRIQSYRAMISYTFQLDTELKFHKAFHALKNGPLEEPHYNDRKCVQYKKLCAVAQHCRGYHAFQERRAGLNKLPVIDSTNSVNGPGGLTFLIKEAQK